MQSFQCPVCGNFNIFGEPLCIKCGQSFIYNCPICGQHINNQTNICPSCRTRFNWYKQAQQANNIEPTEIQPIQYQEMVEDQPISSYKAKSSSTSTGLSSKPSFWITLIIICVILIVVLLFVDRMVS